MKKIIGSVALIAATLFTSAQADNRSFADIYTECGLGGIIGNAAGGGQTGDILAIVTNVTWDLGTTAFSSDITSDNTCANTKAKTAALINEGYNKLEEEIAMGSGKYYDALQKLSANKDIRGEFVGMVSTKGYDKLSHFQKAEKLFDITTK